MSPEDQMLEDFGEPLLMYDGHIAIYCVSCEQVLYDFDQYSNHVNTSGHRRRSWVIIQRRRERKFQRARARAAMPKQPDHCFTCNAPDDGDRSILRCPECGESWTTNADRALWNWQGIVSRLPIPLHPTSCSTTTTLSQAAVEKLPDMSADTKPTAALAAAASLQPTHTAAAPFSKVPGEIPEFQTTGVCQATWCGLSIERDGNGVIWTKWKDEWWVLCGPDPRFNAWNPEEHRWVKPNGWVDEKTDTPK